MSKRPSNNKNLEEARSIRGKGYKSKLDAQPELKEFFEREVYSGATVTGTRRKMLENFPNADVPSQPQLSEYAKRMRYKVKYQEVMPYAPDYMKRMKEFDVISKHYDAAEEAWERYVLAKEAGHSSETVRRWHESYLKALKQLADTEVRFGLRTGMPDSLHMNQYQYNMYQNPSQNKGEIIEGEEGELDELDKLIARKQRLDKLRAAKSGQADGQPDTSTGQA